MNNTQTAAFAEVDDLLNKARHGDNAALERIWVLMQPELKAVARALLRNEQHRTAYGTTGSGLVSELWIRLVPAIDTITTSRGLLACGREAMKNILIDYSRYRNAQRRAHIRTPLEDALFHVGIAGDDVLENVMSAIEALRKQHPRHAEAVELYYIDGFTQTEGARQLEVSRSDFQRMLAMAVGFLKSRLNGAKAG